jgi:flagellar protein FliO/FliZ
VNSGSLFGPLAAFIAIVALIPLSLWLLKRSPLGARLGTHSGGGPAGAMRLVSALPLAQGQRVVTVEVGSGDERRWLVLGVSPAGIRTLHTLTPQEGELPQAAPATPVTPGKLFAQLLARQTGDRDAR